MRGVQRFSAESGADVARAQEMPYQPKITIKKTERRLILSTADGTDRGYPVALGKNWAADKAVEGDHATPLGEFYVCAKNPRSKFSLSLCISYPNAEDAARGLAAGLITAVEHAQIIEAIRLGKMPPQHTKLGGEICIHGQASDHLAPAPKDWTRGCIALDNTDMQEVYDAAAIGMPVVIVE
jgi:murein L,D-transpeptidase YafK